YNKPLCIVEYQLDGNTNGKIKQYRNNPNAFMDFRLRCMDDPYDSREKFWSGVHFVSSAIYGGKWSSVFFNRHRLFTIPAIPLGVALWMWTKWKGAKLGL